MKDYLRQLERERDLDLVTPAILRKLLENP